MSTPQKMLYILNKEQRFMRNREVAYEIYGLDGQADSVNDIVEEISKRTNRLQKQGKVVKFGQHKNTVWGFPEWTVDGKRIMGQFLPKNWGSVDMNK